MNLFYSIHLVDDLLVNVELGCYGESDGKGIEDPSRGAGAGSRASIYIRLLSFADCSTVYLGMFRFTSNQNGKLGATHTASEE
jgi:hypothetical protein